MSASKDDRRITMRRDEHAQLSSLSRRSHFSELVLPGSSNCVAITVRARPASPPARVGEGGRLAAGVSGGEGRLPTNAGCGLTSGGSAVSLGRALLISSDGQVEEEPERTCTERPAIQLGAGAPGRSFSCSPHVATPAVLVMRIRLAHRLLHRVVVALETSLCIRFHYSTCSDPP